MASAGRRSGWTWFATPTPTDSSWTQDRPHAWRYRDYVIRCFNRDKPYDRFINEQIAGDEMFPGDQEALIATGYLRAGSEHLVAGNIDPEESRQEVLTEIATSVGQTFLGLTINCARCHNHKFDPILQADYYRLQAIFAGAKGKEVEIATPEEKAAWEAADKAYKERLKPVEGRAEGAREAVRRADSARSASGQARSEAAGGVQHPEGQADAGAEDAGRQMPKRRLSRPGTKWSRR